MDDRDILLRIRREFSKVEKYRYLLKYLDGVEQERAKERKLNTELMQQIKDLKQAANDWKNKFEGLEERMNKILKKHENCITQDRHLQICKERRDIEKQYHEQVEKNIQLKIQIDKLNAAKGLSEGGI